MVQSLRHWAVLKRNAQRVPYHSRDLANYTTLLKPLLSNACVTDGPATDGPATDGPATDGPATDGRRSRLTASWLVVAEFLLEVADHEVLEGAHALSIALVARLAITGLASAAHQGTSTLDKGEAGVSACTEEGRQAGVLVALGVGVRTDGRAVRSHAAGLTLTATAARLAATALACGLALTVGSLGAALGVTESIVAVELAAVALCARRANQKRLLTRIVTSWPIVTDDELCLGDATDGRTERDATPNLRRLGPRDLRVVATHGSPAGAGVVVIVLLLPIPRVDRHVDVKLGVVAGEDVLPQLVVPGARRGEGRLAVLEDTALGPGLGQGR